MKLQNISKKYNNKLVLNDVTVNIPEGEITVLVGKNGAGKTTLFRIISGLTVADKGNILDINNIGVLLGGNVQLYDNLTVEENINFFGTLNGLSEQELQRNLNDIENYLPTSSYKNNKVFQLSRGMLQKVALTISVLHSPKIVLLDEPSTGLDIITVKDVFKFIKYLREIGVTVLLSSHNITEIIDLSDNIMFLSGGKINKIYKSSEFFYGLTTDEKIDKICLYLE